MSINELTGEQRRQLTDTQQVFQALQSADYEARHRFAGGMRWAERKSIEYLLRKIGRSESSSGRKSPETEQIYDAFITGRAANQDRRDGLAKRLESFAPINRAMRIARTPAIAARILQKCDEVKLLGKRLTVVGTNALYAYEAAAGVQIDSGLLASGDIDLLYDTRRHLSFAGEQITSHGRIGLLRSVDTSFAPERPGSYRAVNRDGYLVDLIRPQGKDILSDKSSSALSNAPDDLQGAAIFGLAWLVNSPKMSAIAVDERGYGVPMAVIDPRAFALHKTWLSDQDDRDPVKAPRDLEQAKIAATIATRYLRRSFDAADLGALPQKLRDLIPTITAAISAE